MYWLFFDWFRCKQDLIAESTSPQGTYTVKAYVSDAGATTSYAILGELIFNHEKRKSKKKYWQYRKNEAYIKWSDDDTISIKWSGIEHMIIDNMSSHNHCSYGLLFCNPSFF